LERAGGEAKNHSSDKKSHNPKSPPEGDLGGWMAGG